jgi:UPF0716 protein FxsA
MPSLLLLFIVVPAVELALLIEIGSRVGTFHTLALIVATGAIGATLANRQGIRTLRTIQDELARGALPADAVQDGVIILIAGALLITPGILTDIVGFLCLIPAVRNAVKLRLRRRFESAVAEQRIHVVTNVYDPRGERPPMIDVTPRPGDPRRTERDV